MVSLLIPIIHCKPLSILKGLTRERRKGKHVWMAKKGADKSELNKVRMATSPCNGKDHDLSTETTSCEEARR